MERTMAPSTGFLIVRSLNTIFVLMLILAKVVFARYDVKIVTSSSHVAGSKGNIYLKMFGFNHHGGESVWLSLQTGEGFETGSENMYIIDDGMVPDIGVLYKIRIKDSGHSDGWNIGKVVIRDHYRAVVTTHEFVCNCWLNGPYDYHELRCPVNGAWSEWTYWSDCNTSCGSGTQSRHRTCTNPAPSGGGSACQGDGALSKICNDHDCPVNGGWSEWMEWSACSHSCAGGIRGRRRTCTNPKPSHTGHPCIGDEVMTQPCNEQLCPAAGRWSTWSEWQQCSKLCGGGSQKRHRSCARPRPAEGGHDCQGNDAMTRSCNTDDCPINGEWSDWTQWLDCSHTCGGGIQSRSRSCTNPKPLHGGLPCQGDSVMSQNCNIQLCPVEGGWSTWAGWQQCSRTCGGGSQTRNRSCTNPRPAEGGQACHGNGLMTQSCSTDDCPINGGWSVWSQWTGCSHTCGGGMQSRSRSCTQPKPMHGGLHCAGDTMMPRHCNTQLCSVALWTAWSEWGPCSVSCGDGLQISVRNCTGTKETSDGLGCAGDAIRHQACRLDSCNQTNTKVNVWGEWSEWSPCPVSCDKGIQTSSRNCTSPSGTGCVGDFTRFKSCSENPCPGAWGTWSSWSACSVSCGGGIQRRNRSCDDPVTARSGLHDCVGDHTESQECNQHTKCVARDTESDAVWSAWSVWSTCGVSCGGGTQTSSRTCDHPSGHDGSDRCFGESTRTRACNEHVCSVWSTWGPWSSCSFSCGGGEMSRTRMCYDRQTAQGRNGCTGPSKQTNLCGTEECPAEVVWTAWSSWSLCTVTCGGGWQTMHRTCDDPYTGESRSGCVGEHSRSRSCNSNDCPEPPPGVGIWEPWSTWSECDVTCGDGIQMRHRNCTTRTPPLIHMCEGASSSIKSCREAPCFGGGEWGEWGTWGKCNVLCGGGIQYSSRACSGQPPFGCEGFSTRHRVCNTDSCHGNSSWSEWSSWSVCPVSCGGGVQLQQRTCLGSMCEGHPFRSQPCNTDVCPVNGGWAVWSDWSNCTAPCGGGTRQRLRSCTGPEPAHSGESCHGVSEESQSCNTDQCPKSNILETGPTWSRWSDWSNCSAQCGEGVSSKFRVCFQANGVGCEGSDRMTRTCKTQDCIAGGTQKQEQELSDQTITGLAIGIPLILLVNAVLIGICMVRRRDSKLKQTGAAIVALPDSPFATTTFINEVYQHFPTSVTVDDISDSDDKGKEVHYAVPRENGMVLNEKQIELEDAYDDVKDIDMLDSDNEAKDTVDSDDDEE